MPKFLYQVSYTSDAWKDQLDNTDNRLDSFTKMVEGGGGKVEAIYYAFGPNDVVFIVDWPSNQEAATLAIAIAAGGAVKSMSTTPLMTSDEGTKAIRAAAGSKYRPPE